MPLILDTEFGLLWIADFEYQGFALQQIHIVGPAFTGSNSHLVLRKNWIPTSLPSSCALKL